MEIGSKGREIQNTYLLNAPPEFSERSLCALLELFFYINDLYRKRCRNWSLSFAKNASAGIALRCRAFVTVMQPTEVRNLDDLSDTGDLPCMWALLVQS